MNKLELIDAVVASSGLTKVDAGRAIDATTIAIIASLTKGESVTLVGFGTFKITERTARIGRNPRTGEAINIAAKKAIGFSAGKPFKDAVN